MTDLNKLILLLSEYRRDEQSGFEIKITFRNSPDYIEKQIEASINIAEPNEKGGAIFSRASRSSKYREVYSRINLNPSDFSELAKDIVSQIENDQPVRQY